MSKRKERKIPWYVHSSIVMLPVFVLCGVLLQSCITPASIERDAHKKNIEVYAPLLKKYIENDKDMSPELKEAHKFNIEQWETLIKEKSGE